MPETFEDLARLALRVLPQMYDPATGLFSHKTWVEDGAYRNGPPSVHYTTMSLAGILEQRLAPPDEVVPVGRVLDALHERAGSGAPDPTLIGNLLWCSARADDGRAPALLPRAALVDPHGVPSSNLGQFVFGVVTAAERWPELADDARPIAERAARELLDRFVPGPELLRIARFELRHPRVALGLRYTSFAAQAYPLHALARWHRWTGTTPDARLRRVAERLVAAQGALGQWWWLYSISAPRIVEGYPVYSVHQDGMAYMALAPLREVGVGDYRAPLDLGLAWLHGANELRRSLVRADPELVFRCIQRTGSDADAPFGISAGNLRAVTARSLVPRLGSDRVVADPAALEILEECRSYHLGWLLYAQRLVSA